MEITIDTFNRQPLLTHRLEMIASGDKGHILPCAGQSTAEITTDASTAVDGYLHLDTSLLLTIKK
jgi:hypothetical protein